MYCIVYHVMSVVWCPRQSLDGIVQRDDKGLEKRFPVILTAEEKLMARQVSLAFKVCIFENCSSTESVKIVFDWREKRAHLGI